MTRQRIVGTNSSLDSCDSPATTSALPFCAESPNKVSAFLMRNSVTTACTPTLCRAAMLHCSCSSFLHLHIHKQMPLTSFTLYLRARTQNLEIGTFSEELQQIWSDNLLDVTSADGSGSCHRHTQTLTEYCAY